VLGDGRLGDPELLLDDSPDFAGGLLTLGQQLEDAAPDRITENVEGVHPQRVSLNTYISNS
jgi:hypothetical protein